MSADALYNRHSLFSPTEIGNVRVGNRIALAPMTRVSATADGRPTDRVGAYYRVFADGRIQSAHHRRHVHRPKGQSGLSLSARHRHRGTRSRMVADYLSDPRERREGLRFSSCTLAASPRRTRTPTSPSPRRPSNRRGKQLAMYHGPGPYRMPIAMTTDDITEVRQAFVCAARLARDAGFDGVEIHGANGYLLDEFLTDYMNTRTDRGSVANRVRFTAEICADVVEEVGADITVGVRISQGKASDYEHRWAGADDDGRDLQDFGPHRHRLYPYH